MDYKRFVAVKVWIADVHGGTMRQSDSSLNCAVLEDGREAHRVNVAGLVVGVDDALWVDDGTGTIAVRAFHAGPFDVEVGQCVLVVGRPREFEGQKYLLGEIVKGMDAKWLEVRTKEVERVVPQAQPTRVVPEQNSVNVVDIVRALDTGEGADYDEVLAKCGSEDRIVHLLAVGELFETKPGRLKVLE